MEAFLVSTGIVALAEIGDKTQILAFILAAKFRKPVPIILGILAATLANHGIAGALGSWITLLLGPETLRWVLGVSFIVMAIWTLIPDKFEEGDAKIAQKYAEEEINTDVKRKADELVLRLANDTPTIVVVVSGPGMKAVDGGIVVADRPPAFE